MLYQCRQGGTRNWRKGGPHLIFVSTSSVLMPNVLCCVVGDGRLFSVELDGIQTVDQLKEVTRVLEPNSPPNCGGFDSLAVSFDSFDRGS